MYTMHCDEDFNVMLAGHKLRKEVAVKLPFKWEKFNKTATAAQIRSEWEMVYGLHIIFPGYYDVTKYVQLYISEKDIDSARAKIVESELEYYD